MADEEPPPNQKGRNLFTLDAPGDNAGPHESGEPSKLMPEAVPGNGEPGSGRGVELDGPLGDLMTDSPLAGVEPTPGLVAFATGAEDEAGEAEDRFNPGLVTFDRGRPLPKPTPPVSPAVEAPPGKSGTGAADAAPPSIDDVAGLENLYTDTTELSDLARPRTSESIGGPFPRSTPPAGPGRYAVPHGPADLDPGVFDGFHGDDPPPEGVPLTEFDSGPAATGRGPADFDDTFAGLDFNPTSTQPVEPAAGPLPRPFEVGGNLRFSTEAGESGPPARTSRSEPVRPFAPPDVSAVPPPVTPNRSVRVPGQQRHHGLGASLIDITERRWFWASVGTVAALVIAVGLVAVDILPSPLRGLGRTDVVTEQNPTIAPAGPADDRSATSGAGDPALEDMVGDNEENDPSGLSTSSSAAVDDSTTLARSTRSTAAPTSTTASVTTTAPSTTTTSTASSATSSTASTTTTVQSSTSASTSGSTSSSVASTTTTTGSSSSTGEPGTSTTTAPASTSTTESPTTTTTSTTAGGG